LLMVTCAGASAQSVLDVFGISVLARSLPTQLLTLVLLCYKQNNLV
jgi:hypothetical protein